MAYRRMDTTLRLPGFVVPTAVMSTVILSSRARGPNARPLGAPDATDTRRRRHRERRYCVALNGERALDIQVNPAAQQGPDNRDRDVALKPRGGITKGIRQVRLDGHDRALGRSTDCCQLLAAAVPKKPGSKVGDAGTSAGFGRATMSYME